MSVNEEEDATRERFRRSAAEERRAMADVLALVDQLAHALKVLRYTQNATVDARDEHLRAIGAQQTGVDPLTPDRADKLFGYCGPSAIPAANRRLSGGTPRHDKRVVPLYGATTFQPLRDDLSGNGTIAQQVLAALHTAESGSRDEGRPCVLFHVPPTMWELFDPDTYGRGFVIRDAPRAIAVRFTDETMVVTIAQGPREGEPESQRYDVSVPFERLPFLRGFPPEHRAQGQIVEERCGTAVFFLGRGSITTDELLIVAKLAEANGTS